MSAEPLLGDIGFGDFHKRAIDWVITGGESGPKRRLLDMEAVRSIEAQCYVWKVAFHHKQNGGLRPTDGGCLIDGREHKEFPPALRGPRPQKRAA